MCFWYVIEISITFFVVGHTYRRNKCLLLRSGSSSILLAAPLSSFALLFPDHLYSKGRWSCFAEYHSAAFVDKLAALGGWLPQHISLLLLSVCCFGPSWSRWGWTPLCDAILVAPIPRWVGCLLLLSGFLTAHKKVEAALQSGSAASRWWCLLQRSCVLYRTDAYVGRLLVLMCGAGSWLRASQAGFLPSDSAASRWLFLLRRPR